MTDKPKTWQEIAEAVRAGGRARGMLEIGELWNAIEEMADRIEERKKDWALGMAIRGLPLGSGLWHGIDGKWEHSHEGDNVFNFWDTPELALEKGGNL